MNKQELFQLIEEIKLEADNMIDDLDKCITNKAAAARARKSTLTLAKLGKEFRKASVECHKNC